jgi:hypothetical protein
LLIYNFTSSRKILFVVLLMLGSVLSAKGKAISADEFADNISSSYLRSNANETFYSTVTENISVSSPEECSTYERTFETSSVAEYSGTATESEMMTASTAVSEETTLASLDPNDTETTMSRDISTKPELKFSDLTLETSEEISNLTSNTERSCSEENLIKLTSDFHLIRVKLAQSSYLIESQQQTISELSQQLSTLEKNRKEETENLTAALEKYSRELLSLKSEVFVARKIVSTERYSIRLREKIQELQIHQKSA